MASAVGVPYAEPVAWWMRCRLMGRGNPMVDRLCGFDCQGAMEKRCGLGHLGRVDVVRCCFLLRPISDHDMLTVRRSAWDLLLSKIAP